MITPDEPWMCGNLTTMPWEPGSRGGGGGGRGASPGRCCICGCTVEPSAPAAEPVWVSCSEDAVCAVHVAVHSEMDLSVVALLMRYIVMSAQAEAAKQNDC